MQEKYPPPDGGYPNQPPQMYPGYPPAADPAVPNYDPMKPPMGLTGEAS